MILLSNQILRGGKIMKISVLILFGPIPGNAWYGVARRGIHSLLWRRGFDGSLTLRYREESGLEIRCAVERYLPVAIACDLAENMAKIVRDASASSGVCHVFQGSDAETPFVTKRF
ncbi:MAG: hypothetical protein A2570_03545 [Candidatus Brennerbacteria bacterium RIFOXYD1_FULL_41_16]|uniref:Uncharacterized protein n=1 Tax=Candidatus Brennerbacteria bacterium RIFOXYD1_FULL_41_16 TaxID=1797529 RepID=A0A1G1XKA0_9BACT|nr:MAG: hypothetical protein A2570_03545 [Candidatus Brennerbacteria bacterium RIFOXYD1_FULL_41_16]